MAPVRPLGDGRWLCPSGLLSPHRGVWGAPCPLSRPVGALGPPAPCRDTWVPWDPLLAVATCAYLEPWRYVGTRGRTARYRHMGELLGPSLLSRHWVLGDIPCRNTWVPWNPLPSVATLGAQRHPLPAVATWGYLETSHPPPSVTIRGHSGRSVTARGHSGPPPVATRGCPCSVCVCRRC